MSITVTADGADATRSLREYAKRIEREAKTSVGRLTLRLLTKVKQDKLSGQVLNVRSGRLRRSINQRVVVSAGRVEGTVGTNVEYAAGHEYGFKGQVSVKAHMRMIKQAFGKSITPRLVQVRAHPREMDLPERSFLRSALRDMQPEIMAELQASVGRAAR